MTGTTRLGRRASTAALGSMVAGLVVSLLAWPGPPAAAADPPGILTVTVFDAEFATALAGATVTVYPVQTPPPGAPADWRPPAPLLSQPTDTGGVASFEIPAQDGPDVKIWIEAPHFHAKWHDSEAHTYATANPVPVTSGGTTSVWDNLTVKRRVVSVEVTDSSSRDLAGATVGLYPASGDGTTAALTTTTSTTGFAQFRLRAADLPPGSYRVKVTRPDYLSQWYPQPGQPPEFDFAQALDLTQDDASEPLGVMVLEAATTPVVGTVPVVSGTPLIGETLAADPGAWTPVDGLVLDYQWLRGAAPISGATGATYVVRPADGGSALTVRVTGHAPDRSPTSLDSAPTAIVPLAEFTRAPVPTIAGRAERGRTLTARPGAWAPTPDRLRYQWYRGSQAVRGATRPRYRLTSADVGKRLTVRVTAAKTGYRTRTLSSARTRVVVR